MFNLDSDLQSAVTAFSARKNIREVFVNKEQSTDSLTVLHGFRAVSCVIVLVLHRFGVIIVGDIMKNADHFQDVSLQNVASLTVLTTTFVDSIFLEAFDCGNLFYIVQTLL